MNLTVLLNDGQKVSIDPDDIWALGYLWCRRVKDGKTYAHNRQVGYLHRAILGTTDPRTFVDHRNGDTLDCTRGNLREATPTVNRRNTAKLRGVHFYKQTGRWNAYIAVEGRRKHLGYFATEGEARAARMAAEREVWGVEPARAHLHG